MCEHCEAETQHREVKLVLEDGRVHHFCSDRCERKWMAAELVRQRRFLNRIFITTRGRASKLAKQALTTNHQPWTLEP